MIKNILNHDTFLILKKAELHLFRNQAQFWRLREGSKVGRIASGEKGRTVTIVGLAVVIAKGQYVPPAMIFPRKRFSNFRHSLDLFSFRHFCLSAYKVK